MHSINDIIMMPWYTYVTPLGYPKPSILQEAKGMPLKHLADKFYKF
jgi:hypothetical protein